MLKLIVVGIGGALVLSLYTFMHYGPLYGVAALSLAPILFALALPRMKRNAAAQKESLRRLTEKIGADPAWNKRITGVYRNRRVEILSVQEFRKFYCLMSVPCGNNRRGLSFRIDSRWAKTWAVDKWAKFNDDTFRAAVLTEERQQILKERFGTHDAGVLTLKDSTVIYNEADWVVLPKQIDRFNLMLDIACDVADLVEQFSEPDAQAGGFSAEVIGRPQRVAPSA